MRPSRLEPERWRRIDGVLGAALDRSPSERASFLDHACAGDPELRREVEALLAAGDRTDGVLEDAAGRVAAGILETPGSSIGRRVGPFRILREIGRGGMGVVYLAEDTRLGRSVALKALPPYLGAGREARRRFEAEARAVSALDHPNIATLYEIDETEEGQLYMVFAYYPGETLERRISRGPLPPDRAVEIATGIAAGLGAAHERRIVHRDVKPSNVLLTRDGGVKLLDFGVAKVAGEEMTGEGIRLGTVAYMSPEQVRAGELDGRADLWSLGVVLYEMLTGSRPFRGGDPAATFQSILDDELAPALPGELPGALDQVVAKLLCKTPEGRYQSAEDLLADLRAVRSGAAPGVAIREPPPPPRPAIQRLAVLPLENLTGSPEQQPLVHGIHDTLIAELGKIRALGVVSRTSVMRLHGAGLSIPEIADALEVDAVVEGSVARDGDHLAI
nr:protein kinase [Gemmatimonadota bacterium]NIQ52186.1 protein kinase [Gemmatimonadota bacterium]NIU72291.1 protein kinase [Gammaproteobacteria bacterium]NIX42788.1 protein kinase [Gemmatimonadota bacterium]NIY06956.1 protein kinase [Gemmatimonadota bacterium]